MLLGEIIAMKINVRYNEGLATTLSEVNVRLIVLLSPFELEKGRIGEKKRVDMTDFSSHTGSCVTCRVQSNE